MTFLNEYYNYAFYEKIMSCIYIKYISSSKWENFLRLKVFKLNIRDSASLA